jgi:glycosyltransferase involved in cell wall biosynthesis
VSRYDDAAGAAPQVVPEWAEWSGATALTILKRLRERRWAGWDPYDALNATRFRRVLNSSSTARRCAAQAVKLSPLPLEPLLGVPASVSAYTVGHAMLACARLHRAGLLGRPGAAVGELLQAATDLAIDGYGGLAWGSHFDVETRFGYQPRTLPNVVVTSFMAKGLLALDEAGLAETQGQLDGIATFVCEALPRLSDERGRLICYSPDSRAPIHNASLLAAGVLSDLSVRLGRPELAREAESAALYTVARQRPDGSWPYAEVDRGGWVDSFHTGFVLEGLARVAQVSADPRIGAALERGMAFYRARLFGARGEPYYSAARRYPFDALSAAQGVETLLATLDTGAADPETLRRLLTWIDAAMVRADGRVAYRVWRRWTDWRQFPRWSLAPMASALAGLAAQAPPPARGAAPEAGSAASAGRASSLGPDDGSPVGRLLMVVHSEYPVGETRVRRQAEAAVAAGWTVHVLALASAGRPRREVCGGVRVFRSQVQRRRDLSAFGLVNEYGRFCLTAFLFCLRAARYQVVVVANPPDFLVFSAVPQRLRGAKVILDVHDLMTDLFAVRLACAPGDRRMRLLGLLERCSMRWADDLMTVHRPYAAEIRQRVALDGAPIVVMNSADEAYFTRRSAAPASPKVIMYHGSIFERYGVFDLLAAFVQVAEVHPEARLCVLGDGDARERLAREIGACPVAERIELSSGFQDIEAVAGRLSQAHVAVIPNRPNELNKYALSTKLLEAVAVGVPVVCAGLPTMREYFGDDELLFFEPANGADLADKLLWALDHYDDMLTRAVTAAARYDSMYAWDLQKGEFLNALRARPSFTRPGG